jgi:hypothetical protein
MKSMKSTKSIVWRADSGGGRLEIRLMMSLNA